MMLLGEQIDSSCTCDQLALSSENLKAALK